MANDNAIIDYSQIQSIITQLGSHEDTFNAFETQNLLILGDGTTGGTSGYPATSVVMSAQKIPVTISGGKGTAQVAFGTTFAMAPVITATAYAEATATPPSVSITTTAATDTTGAQINVSGATGSKCFVSVIAIGTRY